MPPPKSGWAKIGATALSHEARMANYSVYKVIFQNGNQVFEVFAKQIYQSDM